MTFEPRLRDARDFTRWIRGYCAERGDSKSKGLLFLQQSILDVMLCLVFPLGPCIKPFAFSCVHVLPAPLGFKRSTVE